MKTIRLLYPDYVSGGLDTYYFGANLLVHLLPENRNQPLVRVPLTPPDGQEKKITQGIYGKEAVLAGIQKAMAAIEGQKPDKIITIGGNCLVSLAPFDYLHGLYPNTGIVWIDAHPDVSTPKDGYPNAHAMVLGSLMGYGDPSLTQWMKNKAFQPSDILYVGLQGLHDYQEAFLNEVKVKYKIQTKDFVSDQDILAFLKRFDAILVHFDIDVLDPKLFHSTYFANPNLVGDGNGGGKMSLEKLSEILQLISANSNLVGFTIAEYLPFDEYKLHQMLCKLPILIE